MANFNVWGFRAADGRGSRLVVGWWLVVMALITACGGQPQPAPTAPPPATLAPAAASPGAAASPAATVPPAVAASPSPAVAGSPGPAGSPVVGVSPSPSPSGAAGAAASPSPAVVLPPAASPPALARIGGRVSVLATWGGSEQESFRAMVQPFEAATGITVDYEGTRDLNAVLTTRVQGGNPPDLAGLPGPGQMAELARAGKLTDLGPILDETGVRADYAEDWQRLAQVDGKQVGIFVKAALKGPIWYNARELPKVSPAPPKTWDELLALSDRIAGNGTAPWCIGLASGAASGWPGTDWLEDIVLRQAGPDKYDQWWQGTLAWTSPEIKTAWQSWGRLAGDERMVFGGRAAMLATTFQEAGNPLFTTPPRCYLHHQGSFITDFFVTANPGLKPVDDFNFFPFPDIDPRYAGSVEVAGDLFGMFRDTPQARALIAYLATPQAQTIWVQRGGALSPNRRVALDRYPDPLARQQAEALLNARTVRFDASDLMPEAMNNAFLKAILDYVQSPGDLDRILGDLDRTRQDAYRR